MESSYSMKNLIDMIGKEHFSRILRGLFNRIPIVIIGDESIQVDRVVNSLVQLMPHRNELIYWSDFIEENEISQLYQAEESDFNIPRIIIRSPSNATLHALRKIKSNHFFGWVMGYSLRDKIILREALDKIKEMIDTPIILYLNKDKIEILDTNYNWNGKNYDFEKNLIQKAIIETETALEKMKRVLQKKIKTNKTSGIIEAVMTFDTEEEKIRQNIYKQKIDEFVQAANRALAILSRIDLLQELGFNIQISDKTLFKTIDYQEVSYKRLLEFLLHEYGIDFSKCIGTGLKIDIGDTIESKWG
ncbi:MAG: hypothetical protein ACTSPY_00355 [Candidatus Helarchaeota archaeon]